MNGGMAMSSYKDYKKRALQNPEVKDKKRSKELLLDRVYIYVMNV